MAIAALALAGEARADVFVPADPVPGGFCGATAGDVVAGEVGHKLQVSIAGGRSTRWARCARA